MTTSEKSFWRFAVICSRENGLRLSDIAQLEWRCVTDAHTLTVWTGKTNKRLVHKMSPYLEGALFAIIPTHPDFVFPEQNAISRDVKRRALLSVQFKRICEAVGIKGKSFHHLRHAAACGKKNESKESKLDLAMRLVEVLDRKEISAMLGHSNGKTTDIYTNH